MKFRVQIQKIRLPPTEQFAISGEGFLFSILHPNTGDIIHEYFDKFEHLGKLKAGELIESANQYIEKQKKQKAKRLANRKKKGKKKNANAKRVGRKLDKSKQNSSKDVQRPDDQSGIGDSNS